MRLIVYGCGGHGRVVAEAAIAAGVDVLGFIDTDSDLSGRDVDGLAVLGSNEVEALAVSSRLDAKLILGIGSNVARRTTFHTLARQGARFATIVHPTAWISPRATVGVGTVVMAGCIVQTQATIGDNVILNTASHVDHDVVVGSHSHLSPGVAVGGRVVIGDGCHLAVGVSVRNNVTIGANTTIGVGAAVVSSIPADVVAVGVPARVRTPAAPQDDR